MAVGGPLIPAIAAFVAVTALTVSCADGPAATTTSDVGQSSASAPPPAAPTPTTSANDNERIVELSFAGGEPGGETGRAKVALGSTVKLIVSSDVADEIHLHGYDRSADIPVGGTATLTFTADLPGVFEVELEKLGERLTELEVR